MELKHLKSLTQSVVQEADYDRPHPTLSRAEITRLEGKFSQIQQHMEALQSLLEELDEEDLDPSESAVKLHHLGHKGNLDLHAFSDARKKLASLEDTLADLEQFWMMSIQGETNSELRDDPEEVTESKLQTFLVKSKRNKCEMKVKARDAKHALDVCAAKDHDGKFTGPVGKDVTAELVPDTAAQR